MAIIYTYPLKAIPSLEDSIVITDSADNKKTKITSIQSLIDLIPTIVASNAWNRIDANGTGTVQAIGVDQLLTLTSSSLIFSVPGAGTINIEAPAEVQDAWNTIGFPGVAGAPANCVAFGPDQLLNITTGSLIITTVPSTGTGVPSTINIEAPAGDGNIADRNLTFNNSWASDLNNFTWDLTNAATGVMHFETDQIDIGDGLSKWSIPINGLNKGTKNIYLGGDPLATSTHLHSEYLISIGEDALQWAGDKDYVSAGWSSNNDESIAIGYQSQQLFGQVATLPLGPGILTQHGQNVAVGHRSLASNTGNTSGITLNQTLGSFNVAIGGRSMEAANGATANMAIGHNSLLSLIDSSFNTVAGFESGLEHNDGGTGYPTTVDLTTGSSNIMIGKYTNTDNGNNQVIIGDNTSTGTTTLASVPNSNINIGANSYLPTTLSINIGNDNWYDPTGASIVAPVYPAGGGFNNVGDGQIVTIGHQSMYWGNASTAAAGGVTYSTHVGTGQFLYGQAIDAFGNGIQAGIDPADPLNPAAAFSAETDNVVIMGNYAYVAGAENVCIGVESAIGGTYGPVVGGAWEKNVVIGYQSRSNGSWNTIVGEGSIIQSTLGSDVLIGSNCTIDTTNNGFNVVIGCDSNDNGLQANTLVGYGVQAGLSADSCVGIGVQANVNAANSVAIGSLAEDGGFAGSVTLGANVNAQYTNTFTVSDGVTSYIELASINNAAAGTASRLDLAGNLDIIGNKTYNAVVPFSDPPNILKSDFQQTEFTGQTVTKENFLVNTGVSLNIDWNEGDVCVIDLNDQPGNLTINAFYNVKPGTYVIRFEQGAAVATPSVVNYPIPGGPAVWKWPGGVPGALTNAVGAEDVLTIHSDGSALYGVMTNNFL